MGLPSFFKIPEHRTFNFIPRYYDERKEKLQERIKAIEKEMGKKNEERSYQTKITRGSMRGYIDKTHAAQKKSNIRLLIILGILAFLVYLLMFR